jgi:hypothetical protein
MEIRFSHIIQHSIVGLSFPRPRTREHHVSATHIIYHVGSVMDSRTFEDDYPLEHLQERC